ncbi:hypothetical protein HHL17_20570 [Chitinophaga sp. G-6-1-13]|uniref:FAS1 domain-containing protein n=1 Tax=Chitinophaga fulva TaxID=2728842 RepID=A0A848GMG8_9BACT|nr:fasciclin domain-containing protein [Chitinophaga fulva]NML39606.1 hypothetical protein [Chitinophaga fulva]
MKLALALLLASYLVSCKKNDIIDGGTHDPHVNMTTYDYLKSNSWQLFDTTIMLIDKAGLKDVINGDVTFFAPTDNCINKYLAKRRDAARKISEKLDYNLDSLLKEFTPQMLHDSMGMYIFKGKITRDQLTSTGKSYESVIPGAPLWLFLIPYQYVNEGLMTTNGYIVSARRVYGEPDIIVNDKYQDPTGKKELLDISGICQTSGVLTTNGVLHVMANSHVWNFLR